MGIVGVMKLVPLIVSAVQAVEGLVTDKKGKAKQDAAVDMVRSLMPLIEGYVGRDLLDDTAVAAAVRSTIDAVVHLQNVAISARRAKPSAA